LRSGVPQIASKPQLTPLRRLLVAKRLELDRFVLHLHGRAGVDLQGHQPAGFRVFRVVIDDLDGFAAVDLVNQPIALGRDLQLGPLGQVDRLEFAAIG
jgi:hypothetical protein